MCESGGIVELKCKMPGCNRPVKHSRTRSVASDWRTMKWVIEDYCDGHGLAMMRCQSNRTGASGECLWCDADQGESCRGKNK